MKSLVITFLTPIILMSCTPCPAQENPTEFDVYLDKLIEQPVGAVAVCHTLKDGNNGLNIKKEEIDNDAENTRKVTEKGTEADRKR